MSGSDGSAYHAEYTYDAAGNRTGVRDDGNSNSYVYDELNRVTGAEWNFDGATYQTGYTGKSTNPHSHYTVVEVPPGVDIFTIYTNAKGKQFNCRVDDLLRQKYSVNPLMYKWWDN